MVMTVASISANDDLDYCRQLLEAHDYDLEIAVNVAIGAVPHAGRLRSSTRKSCKPMRYRDSVVQVTQQPKNGALKKRRFRSLKSIYSDTRSEMKFWQKKDTMEPVNHTRGSEEAVYAPPPEYMEAQGPTEVGEAPEEAPETGAATLEPELISALRIVWEEMVYMPTCTARRMEKYKERHRAYYQKNKEKCRVKQRAYYQKNKEKYRAYNKAYKKREDYNAKRQAYEIRHKEKMKAAKAAQLDL